MRLVERAGDRWVFGLGMREKALLERLLQFYPMRPEGGATLSREGGPGWEDAEGLLRETLREQRDELGAWSRVRLSEGAALHRSGQGWHLALEGGEVERLLQVLNELRVGAWTRLGCPEDLDAASLAADAGRAPMYMIMMLAGQFEMDVLHALNGEESPGRDPAA